jgi:formylmethanofuran dehydrogenase subunit E
MRDDSYDEWTPEDRLGHAIEKALKAGDLKWCPDCEEYHAQIEVCVRHDREACPVCWAKGAAG